MKTRTFLLNFTLTLTLGCSSVIQDDFNSKELVSTKGEHIYVNTLNWGITGDYQISAISNNKNKVSQRSDSLDIVKGLDPFIYKLKNDTLTLYFDEEVNYQINQQFKTINVKYVPLDRNGYNEIRSKARDGKEGYCSVPEDNGTNYPSDMPRPVPK